MISIRRWRLVAGVTTATVIGAALLAPAAQARPSSPVVKSWHTAPGAYIFGQGMGSIWAVNADEQTNATLYRINPGINVMTRVTRLPFPVGSIVVGAGSVWLTDYYGNSVYRLAPSGTVQARITVGLQPQWMDIAFGSLWVSNHHSASVSRINLTTNQVQDTITAGDPTQFRNGPQAIAHDASRVYVANSNLPYMQAIDPSNDAVSDLAGPSPDAFCGPLLLAGGHVWSPDQCTGYTWLLNTDGSIDDAVNNAPGIALDITALGTNVWEAVDETGDPNTGYGRDGALEQRDPSTGALLRTIALGGDVRAAIGGFGDLWVYDAAAGAIRRVRP